MVERPPRITVVVRRDDGDVFRMAGQAAIAACTTFHRDDPAREGVHHVPIISLRADTPFQLAILLAGVISAAQSQHPDILGSAIALSRTMNCAQPEVRRMLPPRGDRG